MPVTWDEVASNPRFQGLDPAEQAHVRREFDARYGGASLRNAPTTGTRAPSDWIEQMAPEDEAALREQLSGMPVEERERQLGLTTGRLVHGPGGETVPRPQGPPPTAGERLVGALGPPLRGAARLQQMLEYPFKRGGEYLTEHTEPYLEKVLPEGAAKVGAGLLGGAVEYAPYAPLLTPGGLAAGGGRAALRRILSAGTRFAGLEAERRAGTGLAEGEAVTPEQLAEAAKSGFVGGAAGQGVLGEVVQPLAAAGIRALRGRLAARGAPVPMPTPAPATAPPPAPPVVPPAVPAPPLAAGEALRQQAAGQPVTVEPPPSAALPASIAGTVSVPEGLPASAGASQAAATAEAALRAPAKPVDAATRAAVTQGQPTPPEAEEALALAEQAERDGRADEARSWRQVADEIIGDYRRANPAATDFEVGPRGGIARPGEGPDYRLPVPVEQPSSALRGGAGEPGPAQERLRRMILGQPAPSEVRLPALPEQRVGMARVLHQAADAIATRSGHEPTGRPDFLVTPEGAAMPPGEGTLPAVQPPVYPPAPAAEPTAPLPPERALVPSSRFIAPPPGAGGAPYPAGVARTVPRPQTEPTPAATAEALRMALELARRRRAEAPPSRPTEAPTNEPAGGGAAEPGRLPQEIEDVVAGRARAWLRPPAAEGTVPTAGERAMADVDLRRFAGDRGLGYLRGRDGTEVVYNPDAIRRPTLELADRMGALADVVNGPGTSPKPTRPTSAVIVRDREGREIRTVLTASPEQTAAAAAAQPPGTTVEVRPAAEGGRAVLAERQEGTHEPIRTTPPPRPAAAAPRPPATVAAPAEGEQEIADIIAGGTGPRGAGGELPRPAHGGGPGGAPQQTPERITVARPEFTAPADTRGVPQDVRRALSPHQVDAVAKAQTAMDERGGFLLADGTGVGKTRSELATAHLFAARGHPVVIVTKAEVFKPQWGEGTYSGSFLVDGEAVGVRPTLYTGGEPLEPGQIYLTSYDRLDRIPVDQVRDRKAVLVFDETHALKNTGVSARANMGMGLLRAAHAVLYATATPADRPGNIEYLFRTGLFGAVDPEQGMRDLGLKRSTKEGRTAAGKPYRKVEWVIDPRVGYQEVGKRLASIFNRLTQAGAMLKREISMRGVDVEVHRVDVPAEARATMDAIERGFLKGVPLEETQGLKKANVIMHMRRQLEPYKVPATVEMALEELRDGRQTVIYTSRINPSQAAEKIYARDPRTGERYLVETRVHAESEGTARLLKEALARAGVTDVVELHGNAETTGAESMRRFQSGEARVLVATIESGGTGINLDDTVGNHPRTLIVMTAPFSAVENVQAAGRVWRLTTRSFPRVRYVMSDLKTDKWNMGIIATKMRSLGATVRGEVRVLDPNLARLPEAAGPMPPPPGGVYEGPARPVTAPAIAPTAGERVETPAGLGTVRIVAPSGKVAVRLDDGAARLLNPADVHPAPPTSAELEPLRAASLPEAPAPAAGRGGTETRATTPKFPDVKARWEAVERRDLVVSHQPEDFSENPRFPQEFQPRKREGAAAQQQVRENATRLDAEQLAESPTAAHGAPVIGPDNLVESGNGRVLALDLAARQGAEGRYGAYRQWVQEHAARFGLDPEAVAAMEQPVLVRRRVTELDAAARRDYVRDANADTLLRYSASEQGRVDAQAITTGMLDRLDVPETGDLLARSNRDFVQAFADQVVGHSGATGDFYTAGGDVSQAGALRIRSALLAKIFDDRSTVSLLERLTESTDDNTRNVTGAILDAVGPLARMKSEIAAGHLFDRDLSPAIAEAAAKASAVRAEGGSLADYLKQADLFGRDPVTTELIRAIDEFGRSRKRLAQVFRDYAEVLAEHGDPGAPRLPGAPRVEAAPPVAELLAEAVRRTREEYGGQGMLLGVGKRKTGTAALDEAIKTLDAQIRVAEAGGDRQHAATLRAQRDFMKQTGRPPLAGGGDLLDRVRQVLRASGVQDDERVAVQVLDDVPQIGTYLGTSGFVVRRYLPFRRMVQRLTKGIDDGDRLHKVLLERPAREGIAESGGWRPIQRLIPAAETEAFRRTAWEGDLDERLFSDDELRARGLGPGAVTAYHQMQRLLDFALRRVINPIRKDLGLTELEGRRGYLPHRWFGTYDVYVDGQRVPGSWQTTAEAYGVAAKILKSGELPADANLEIIPRFREVLSELPDVVEARALQGLLSRLEKNLTVSREDILDAYRAGIEPRGFPRHFERRKGVPGYETERLLGEDGVVDRYLSEISRWAPMRRATEDLKRLLSTVDASQQPHLFNFMQRLISRVQGRPGAVEIAVDDAIRRFPILGRFIDPVRPTMRAARATRNVVSHLKLGLFNLSAGIVNSFQFITHATPLLGEYAAKGAWRTLVPDKEAALLLSRFKKLGLLEPMFIRGETAAGKGTLGKAADVAFFPMSAAERFNRAATLLGSYYRARDLGMQGDRLIKFASDFARDKLADVQRTTLIDTARKANDLINFRYDVASRPAFTTGPAGELAGQFKTFTVATLELQRRLWSLAAEGDVTPVLAHYGAMLALSGLMGFPFVYAADQIVRWATDERVSPIDALTTHLPSWATRGLPAFVGVDVSRRVGMGDIIPQRLQDLAGPAVGTFLSAMQFMRDRDLDMVARNIAPGPAAFYMTWRDYVDGLEREPNSRQRMRFQPDNGDLVARALGVQPLRVSELQDTVRTTKRQIATYKSRRAQFTDEAVAARKAGDHARTFDIIRESREVGAPITFHDVLVEQHKKAQPTIERLAVQVPKPMRATLRTRLVTEAAKERLRARIAR